MAKGSQEQYETLEVYRARIDHAKSIKRDYSVLRGQLDDKITRLVDERKKLDQDNSGADDVITKYTVMYDAQLKNIQDWDTYRPRRYTRIYKSDKDRLLAEREKVLRKLTRLQEELDDEN